jgi:DNA adenine methylase
MVVNRDVSRPIGQFYGGKWLLAPWVLSFMPSHRVYVELFGGGGSVLLRKPRSDREIYNDIDSDIVNVFRVLRDRPDELLQGVDLTPYSREEYELACEPSEDPVERARRSLVRLGMGHSGGGSQYDSFLGNGHRKAPPGFRTGELRKGGSSAGGWATFSDVLGDIVERFKGVTIECRDALDLLPVWDSPGTVFYADPPYLPDTRRTKSVYKHEMTEEQHVALAKALNQVQGLVLVSGYESHLYDELYVGWEKHFKEARSQGIRRDNPYVDVDRVEVLWVKRGAGRF